MRVCNSDLRLRIRILDANAYGSDRIQTRNLPEHNCGPSKTICCLIENLSLSIIKYYKVRHIFSEILLKPHPQHHLCDEVLQLDYIYTRVPATLTALRTLPHQLGG
jgi:hypothetical protein